MAEKKGFGLEQNPPRVCATMKSLIHIKGNLDIRLLVSSTEKMLWLVWANESTDMTLDPMILLKFPLLLNFRDWNTYFREAIWMRIAV